MVYGRGVHVPGASSSWRRNCVLWLLIFVDLQYGTSLSHTTSDWYFEVASRLLETLYTPAVLFIQ
jgi:ABC-type nickel/cobalt efflux system permease component RcnA